MYDLFDQKLLSYLQTHGNATNAELGDVVGISPSQAGRRKLRLENEGIINRYEARVEPEAVGLTIQAFVQISLTLHSKKNADDIHDYLCAREEIVNIWTMTGRADYLLQVYCRDLAALNALIHDGLLAHKNISHVESQIVMNHLKRRGALPIAP